MTSQRDVHAELEARLAAAALGGPEEARSKHVTAGRLLVLAWNSSSTAGRWP